MAIATVFNNLGVKITPTDIYNFAKKNHLDTGDSVVIMSLLQKLCREYPVELDIATTFTEQAMFSIKYEGAQVISQTFGAKDIFSEGLHFMALVAAGKNQFLVVDPEFHEEKYAGKPVKVYPKRKLVVADYKILNEDADGSPMFYILKKK